MDETQLLDLDYVGSPEREASAANSSCCSQARVSIATWQEIFPSSLLQAVPVQHGYLKVKGVEHALFVGANVVGRANVGQDESQRKATLERFQSQRNLHHVHGEFPAAAWGIIM